MLQPSFINPVMQQLTISFIFKKMIMFYDTGTAFFELFSLHRLEFLNVTAHNCFV